MKLVIVVHNVRSALNVGSILRTADGLGADKVYMTGYTPYPAAKNDERPPHHSKRTAHQIHKTALGAEEYIKWQYIPDIGECLANLRKSGYMVVALEQAPGAENLNLFMSHHPVALVVGNEVHGLEASVLKLVDKHIHIPMEGHKESLNVSIAAAIAIYHLRSVG